MPVALPLLFDVLRADGSFPATPTMGVERVLGVDENGITAISTHQINELVPPPGRGDKSASNKGR